MSYDPEDGQEISNLPAVHSAARGSLAQRPGMVVGSARKITVTHRGTGETFAIKPQGDRVLVKPIKEGADRRYGSLYIPDTSHENSTVGRVIAAGPGRHEGGVWIPMPDDITPGVVVVFGKHAGTEVEVWGTELLTLRAADIMFVCDDVLLDEVEG